MQASASMLGVNAPRYVELRYVVSMEKCSIRACKWI